MTSTHEVDDYLHRLHRAARRLPADERDERVVGLGTHAEQIRARGLDRNRPGRRSSGSVTLRPSSPRPSRRRRSNGSVRAWRSGRSPLPGVGVLAALALGPALDSTALSAHWHSGEPFVFYAGVLLGAALLVDAAATCRSRRHATPHSQTAAPAQ